MIHSNSSLAVKPSSIIKILVTSLTKKQPEKKEAAKQAAKEQSAKEQSAKEKVAKEQAAKEEGAKKQAAKEQAAKEEVAKEQAAKEQIAKEQEAKEQAEKEQQAKILDVPLINQLTAPKLYNGCEVTSLAMILNYNGYHVTKNELANNIARVPLTYQNGLKGNPNVGFVGNMEVGPGYAVYNGPIYNLAKKYAGNEVVNLTNQPFTDLLVRVSQGEPVWIITTETFSPVSEFKQWKTPQGSMSITFSEHSVVITGYDANYIYINNPYGQKNQRLNRSSFERAWEQMGKQAIVIEK
ncbi:C39 family peptidase [Bacillus sp. EB600]|uniref:C39 family peptidase n=1 Tax=Bacillus sp. EB600 TaxID=2806345 RepID=UPI00210AF6B1|nr:C39 family peptidase [Bacillus sp. EB600]